MGKSYMESSLKRFLKRKVKITLGIVVAFLITGNVGLALTITKDNITNFSWANKNTIKEQIELEDAVADSKIDIFNNGNIIITNNEITDEYATDKGNGLEANAENITLKNIKNTGKIITTNTINVLDASFLGNGISFCGDGNLKIENIVNTGEIIANSNGYVEYGNILGNGISFYGDGNLKIENIVNTGEITGTSLEKNSAGGGIGNGIIVISYQTLLDKIKNTGKITGSINNIMDGDLYINEALGMGNGMILMALREKHDNLSNITNNGIITGNINNILSKELDNKVIQSGNGILLSGINSSIENTGLIKGHINKYEKILDEGLIDLKDNASGGNGIEISDITELRFIAQGENKDTSIIQDNLTNNGVITGSISEYKENIQGTNIGNGVGYFYQNNPRNTIFNIKLSNIINNGLILGNAGDILNTRYINLLNSTGNGVGISAFSGKCIAGGGNTFKGLLENFNNTGKISGNVNQIGGVYTNAGNGLGISLITNKPDEKFGEFTLNNLHNSGILSGNVNIFNTTNEIEHTSVKHTLNLLGNGLGINVYAGKQEDKSISVGEIINTGKIVGNVKQIIKDNHLANTMGNGIGITSSCSDALYLEDFIPTVNRIENTGIILGKENGIYIAGSFLEEVGVVVNEIEKLEGELLNYSNGGIVVGKNPIYAQEFTNDMIKSADKGVAIKLDANGNIESIVNGIGGELNGKTIINANINNNDSFISINNKTNYVDTIINGVGMNNAVLDINAKTEIKNSIVNAFGTAINIKNNNEFFAVNTIFNGGGLDDNIAVITDKGNSNVSLNSSIINGNIALSNGNSTLNIVNSQLNGNISGGEGKDTLTIGELNFFQKIEGFEDIIFKGNTTLYETSKVLGANKIEIDSGAEVNLRVDSSKKDKDNTYKEHALFNSSNQKLILSGNTNAITENDVDENGNFSVVENEDKLKYDKVSILNIITNGLGINAKIDLGNTKVEDNLWVKTDSILNQATKKENEKGTILTIEAEKDLFNIIKKIEKPAPKPEVPLTPLEPAIPINPKPESESPVKPNTPSKYENLYVKLNEVYKGICSSNDDNFNALNDIVTSYTFENKDKGDYPIIGNEKMQMATLLGYLRSVYSETPYSFSNESTRKSMELFHDTVRDNNFKAKKDEWLIYGGLVHQNGDQEQTYYGRNYHGFDTGTAETDTEIKLTGAYGQFEYGNTDTLSTGIMVGGTKSDVEVASSKLEGTGAYVGVYAKKDIKDLRITSGIGYQYTEYDGTRRTINETYSEDYKDEALNLYLDGKYTYDLGNNLYIEPKAGLSYTHIDQDSIKENKDKALALNIDSKDFDVLEGTVGVDIKKVILTEKGKHSVSAGISYRHILDGADIDYLTADFGGQDFEILVPHKNKGQMSIGVRYETELENGMFYDVKGNYFMNVDSKENTHKNADTGEWRVGVGIGYKFSTLKDLTLENQK